MFVKICGVTNVEDALLAAGLGANAVGMIFAASSRRIATGEARDIVRRLPPEVLPVGVFRDERAGRVAEIANSIGLRAVQLSGHESVEDTRWLAGRVPVVIKAFAAQDPNLARAADYGAHRLLIDSASPGSGKTFDWTLLQRRPVRHKFLLAGGLTPGNVAEAITTVKPWGVDLATGVEASPGVKDPAKLRQFMANVRAVAPEEPTFEFELDPVPVYDEFIDVADDGPDGPGHRPAADLDRPFNWEEDSTWH
ncbi:MAG: phosphoribosylanthranilate isomerase [Actinomycetota bacterium]